MIDLVDLKLYIGAVGDGDDADTILSDLEEFAVALISRATGRYFGDEDPVTVTIEGFGVDSLFLPDPFSVLTSVSVREELADDWSELTATDYELSGDGNELLRRDGNKWPIGRARVRVAGTRGYVSGSEPLEIRQLVMDLVNWQYRAGRKLALEDVGSPDVGAVKGWDRIIALYRGPLYG